MEAVGIVLNIGVDHVEEFENGFRQHELPVWEEYVARGIMLHASLTKMDIATQPVAGAVQYLISVAFADGEGHHLHDSDPRFRAWNELADAYQIAPPYVNGGAIIISAGENPGNLTET
jgi:hypothetical protein